MNNDSKNNAQRTVETDKRKLSTHYWLVRRANGDGVTGDQRTVYDWIYAHNRHNADGTVTIFGRPSYEDYYRTIAADLGYKKPRDIVAQLKKKGWLKETPAKAYKGIRMVGFLCMIDPVQANAAKSGEQQELKPLEEQTTTVPSSIQADVNHGEGWHFGYRYYLDADGNEHRVPKNAPPRPTDTAVWDDDTAAWYEPEDLPDTESEF